MSSAAQPISSAAFSAALEGLPAETLYTKAAEIRNSVAHLERSNAQLQHYSDSIAHDPSIPADVRGAGDQECLDAIRENTVVIDRQKARIALLEAEVERRGGRWHDAGAGGQGSEGANRNGARDATGDDEGRGEEDDDDDDDDGATPDLTRASTINTQTSSGGSAAAGRQGPRLTDEELRRRLAERMGEDGEGEDDDGMHL